MQKLFETPAALQQKVDQKILNTIPEGYYDKVNAQPLLNTSDLATAMQLGDLKQQHHLRDLVIGAIDDQLKDSSLSENDRNKALAAKAAYQDEQEQIHQYADMLRNASGSNVDWSNYGFGSNDNLAQTQVSLYNQQRRNLQNLLNLETPRAFNRQRRDELKKEGYNPFHALVLANEETKDYVDDASNRMANAMNFYGVNSDGSLNSTGVALANRWAKFDPQSAGVYLQSYASPNAQFQARVNLANSLMNLEHGDWRALLGAGVSTRGQDMSKKIADQKLGYDYDVLNKVSIPNMEANKLKAQAEEIYRQQSAYAKTPIGKMQGTYEALLALGYSENEAAEMTRQNFVNSLLPNNGKAFENDEGVENAVDSILYLIGTGEEDTAGRTLQNILQKRDEDAIGFYSKVSPEMRAKADKVFSATQKYLDFSGKSTDTKAKDNAKIKLQAELRSALDPKGRPASLFEQAIRQSMAAQRHKLDGKTTAQIDAEIKELLKEGGGYDEKTNTYRGDYHKFFLPFGGNTFKAG